ncbi:hypothetical protein SAMN05443572_105250 [Myxococcus fulvus]|uniref:Uncharacterized protein n=1 Tax=Myxococcus fulvus TaxID=33 RepID=A0A511T5V8_MYXFU|nr:hypothetical protein [Myxococcus fulvus]GEN08993.1 hypothetical protein MFU01_40300 [Myxococcus fulvus]SEU14107.1 hypothetical protein SAMN05443572_105250 [Myxococcus fulvus]
MSLPDIHGVADTATSFISDYLVEHGYFTPSDELDENDDGALRLSLYRALPDQTAPGTIVYTFIYGSKVEKDGPELQQWVQQIMTALKQAHPEVSRFKSTIELDAWNC